MPTIYMNRGPCAYVFPHLMMGVVRLLVIGCGYVSWLSFRSLLFVFFGHVLQSGFNLVENGFGSFGWDAGCWMQAVTLLTLAATAAFS